MTHSPSGFRRPRRARRILAKPGRFLLALCLLALCLVVPAWLAFPAWADTVSGPCAQMLAPTGAPLQVTADGAAERPLTLLCRRGFVLGHDGVKRSARWVLERLARHRFSGDGTRERSRFQPDRQLPAGERSALRDYRGSGYDRGHLAPAANMKWDQAAMDESFLLSNIAPQVGSGFNRGIWRRLEAYVRDLVPLDGDLVVITGPLYRDVPRWTQVDRRVAVPSHFFKLLYDPAGRRALTFILPNRSLEDRSLASFVVSVNELESLAGLDFLAALPDPLERRVEAQASPLWASPSQAW